jgi:hypothetical protein
MPRGPKGEKRPADVIGNAVHVMRIATGEEPGRRDGEGAPGSKGSAPSYWASMSGKYAPVRGGHGRLSC